MVHMRLPDNKNVLSTYVVPSMVSVALPRNSALGPTKTIPTIHNAALSTVVAVPSIDHHVDQEATLLATETLATTSHGPTPERARMWHLRTSTWMVSLRSTSLSLSSILERSPSRRWMLTAPLSTADLRH